MIRMNSNDVSKMIVLLLLILCGLTSAACWDARELSDTSIVLGVAVDGNEEKLQLTLELCPSDSKEALLLCCEGRDAAECAGKLQELSEGELFWGGATAVIFGSGVSQSLADKCSMYFYQVLGLSGKTPLLRSVDSQAADILEGSFGQAPYVSLGLGEALRRDVRLNDSTLTLVGQLQAALGEVGQGQAARVRVDEEGMVALLDVDEEGMLSMLDGDEEGMVALMDGEQ